MNKIKINLNDYKKIKEFVNLCCTLTNECILESEDGKYRVDAKSILGVFALDLSMPVILKTEASKKLFKNFIYEKEDD